MNKSELINRIRLHQEWLETDGNDSTLRLVDEDVDFSSENWSKSNLSCALLFNSNFDGCNLSAIDFFQAELQGSSFVNATITNVMMSKANIDGCVFDGARLDGAKLRRIASVDVAFVGASLVNADLGNSTFIRGNFDRANLSGADFSGAILDNCRFCESRLTGIKGLESVRIDSFLTVGMLDSPKKLEGQAAIDWFCSQTS